MKNIIVKLLYFPLILIFVTGCKSDEDKVKEIASAYISKQMKNPESFKIISVEVKKDTIPFYLTDEILDLAKECDNAINVFNRYKDMSYLFIDEKIESAQEAAMAKEKLVTAYKYAQESDSVDIEYVAYMKFSGTNPIGGTVANSSVVIIDKNNPTKVLGAFIVDDELIKNFVLIKVVCEDYEFKTNKFGKYETNGMSYLEQFIMNDAK